MGKIHEILEKYWGYKSFRPMQEEIINSALEGNDVLALMPTGGGKSICFQVPALAKDGIAIVVSPLIALMKDQVSNLKERGVRALAVYSGMSAEEIDAALDNAVYGNYKLLYVSPERLKSDLFRARAAKMNVSFLVVDEAHCISQWGYDFRPDYLEIAEIKKIIGPAPVIAVTATATKAVAQDIMSRLGFRKENVFVSGFERPNLSYVVRHAENKAAQIMRIIKSVGGSGIIYVRSRKRTQEIASLLKASGIPADFYHAGLSAQIRAARQNMWKSGEIRVIVATNAFGMGIDKADVRFVVHYDIPESIEAYFQEAGRAGRDGKRSYAVLLGAKSDIAGLKRFLPSAFPEIDYISDIYQKVFKFLKIPYESGKGETYEFNPAVFAKNYGLQQAKAFYALKHIENEGYWTLTDEIDNPSKIVFTVSRDELYKIQLNDIQADSFIKTVLRLYTGLFSYPVKIDEEYIAMMHRCSADYVKSMLIALSRRHIIRYIPKSKSPMIIFNNERLVESNFYMNRKRYDALKKAYSDRLDAMASYVMEDNECRAVALAGYFGQSVPECGCCDVCLSKGVKRNLPRTKEMIKESVAQAGGRLDISAIQLEFENKVPDIVEIAREMVREGIFRLEDETVLVLGKIKSSP